VVGGTGGCSSPGFGDRDIPEHPRDDSAFYSASNDITVFIVEGSAHCHNFAGKRAELWDRIAAWALAMAPSATAQTPR